MSEDWLATKASIIKEVTIGVLLLTTFFVALLPRMVKSKLNPVVFSVLNCLAGGVVLGSAFSHMIPAASNSFREYWDTHKLSEYPWAFMFSGMSLLALLSIDKIFSGSHSHDCDQPDETVKETNHTVVVVSGNSSTPKIHQVRAVKLNRSLDKTNGHAHKGHHGGHDHGHDDHGHSHNHAHEQQHSHAHNHHANGHNHAHDHEDTQDRRHHHEKTMPSTLHTERSRLIESEVHVICPTSPCEDPAITSIAEDCKQEEKYKKHRTSHKHHDGHIHEHHHEVEHYHYDDPSGLEHQEHTVERSVDHFIHDRKKEHRAKVIQAYIFLFAISLHSLFEGLGMGAEQDMDAVVGILLAVISHKLLEAFALGCSLHYIGLSTSSLSGVLLLYSFMTPFGIGCGMFLGIFTGQGYAMTSGILVSLASGSFLYVSLIELIPSELGKPGALKTKLLAIWLGWAAMVIAAYWV